MSLKLPIATSELLQYLPHRPPAVWVDEVVSVKKNEGECRVKLSADASYVGNDGKVRPSSYIEWMAQAYGYVGASQILMGIEKTAKPATKAFLVQIKDYWLSDLAQNLLISENTFLTIKVKGTHQLGNISIITGEVLSSNQNALARANFKLFAE